MILSGWGRFPQQDCRVRRPRNEDDIRAWTSDGHLIARGNGRAYGDSAMSATNTIDMRSFNRMLAFDDKTGLLTVESGVLLSDIIDVFLPRGWFPTVTPGTKFVTVGGMVAADVHGKNHHKDGSFGTCVDWIEILTPAGELVRCSRRKNADLFAWTVGGMGLTGVVVRVAFRLRPVETGWIRQTVFPARDLASAMELFEDHQSAKYSMAWIDCLSSGPDEGRSLVMVGEHARRDELPPRLRTEPCAVRPRRKLSMPFNAPSFVLNRYSVSAFNALYYRRGSKNTAETIIDWDSFFYPLDAILGWNRIYGRKGFIQFQCVLPLDRAADGLRQLVRTASKARQASFLAVLKRLGPQESRFSFPMEGYTLALDFPIKPGCLALLDELDRIVIDHKGRFYLAKDSRMTAETLRQTDLRAQAMRAMRKDRNLTEVFASSQSERLRL